jgi:Zn-dependent protease
LEQFFFKLSIMLVPAMMAITCHEVSHGYVAYRFGDGTAKSQGRLTLNPFNHLDIVGTLMIFIIGIGWAKPVPVNFNNLRNPKRNMIWVAAAGPITNFSIALVSAIALRMVISLGGGVSAQFIVEPVVLMLAFSVYVNLLLAIFNLIPVPPLDGGRVLVGLLPYKQAVLWSKIEPYGMLIIIALVFFTNLFSYIISPALSMGIHLLAGPHSKVVFGVTSLLMK